MLRSHALPLGRSAGSFPLQRVLRDFDQFVKRSRIRGGDVRQNLTVQPNLRRFEPFHEPAVSGASGANGRIDADLPERPEIPLLGFAVTESIGPAMVEGVGSVTIQFGAAHPKAFGGSDGPGAA